LISSHITSSHGHQIVFRRLLHHPTPFELLHAAEKFLPGYAWQSTGRHALAHAPTGPAISKPLAVWCEELEEPAYVQNHRRSTSW
jgi:hypothetical protein